VRSGPDALSLVIGLMLGFFFGCCGILIALLFHRRDYLPGAALGFALQAIGSMVVGSLSAIETTGLENLGADVPWELVAAFAIVVTSVSILGAAGIWAFAGDDDEDDEDDDGPPSPPRPSGGSWVTFER